MELYLLIFYIYFVNYVTYLFGHLHQFKPSLVYVLLIVLNHRKILDNSIVSNLFFPVDELSRSSLYSYENDVISIFKFHHVIKILYVFVTHSCRDLFINVDN